MAKGLCPGVGLAGKKVQRKEEEGERETNIPQGAWKTNKALTQSAWKTNKALTQVQTHLMIGEKQEQIHLDFFNQKLYVSFQVHIARFM